jgi:diguanylate cyclase (GGDEF)-like protein
MKGHRRLDDQYNSLPQVTDDIDQCLLQPWYRVRFPAVLERRFEEATAKTRCSHTRFGLLFMAGMHFVLLVPDSVQGRHMLMLGLILRVGVCVPLLAIAAALLQPRRTAWLQGLIAMSPAIFTFCCDEWLARHASTPVIDRYFMVTAMGLFVGNVLVPLRLRHALVFNALNLVSFNAALRGLFGPVPLQFPTQFELIMSFLVVVAAGIRWRNEVQERETFLLNERDRLQSKQLKWANRQLTELSYTDALTGLPNRRFFDDALIRSWNEARDSGSALNVLMIDLDQFKAYNDTLGHAAGDKCLRRVAQGMQFTIRMDKDSLARYGGEEFIAVIPDASPAEARHIAERIRIAVQELQIPHPCSPVSTCMSVCIGLATAVDASSIGSLDALLRAADFALYKAKAKGRNCVVAREVGNTSGEEYPALGGPVVETLTAAAARQ